MTARHPMAAIALVYDAPPPPMGPEDPRALELRTSEAIALRRAGKLAEAEVEHRAIFAIREKTLGPEHPTTLGTKFGRKP
jgi:hypothetical protein